MPMIRLTDYDVFSLPATRIFYNAARNCRGEFTLQSCKDLADSIDAKGLDFPIVVQPIEEVPNLPEDFDREAYDWMLLAGHRRYKAMTTFLKWNELPCNVRYGLTEKQARMLNFTENLERKDLNILEEARWLGSYFTDGESLRTIAKEIKRDTGWVHVRLRLLELPEEVQRLAMTNQISCADIETIFALDTPELQLKCANDIIAAKRIGKSYETAGKYGRKFAYRKSKAQIGQMVSHLMQVGLEGLVTRFGAWCAGYIDDDAFAADIAKELRARRAKTA